MPHAHVTRQRAGFPALVVATGQDVYDLLCVFDNAVGAARDGDGGMRPRDAVNGVSNGQPHQRQILDRVLPGTWVQIDLFGCEAADCAPRGADVPPFVGARA